MSENYYEYLKNNPIYYSVIVWGVLFLTILKFFMDVYGYKCIAEYKANNKSDILAACIYYTGDYKTKYGESTIFL